MAVRKILVCGDPVLRKKARRVRDISDELVNLLDDMVETMLQAPGIGLAAPQVGVDVRAIVFQEFKGDDDEPVVRRVINPRIVARDGEQAAYEGCLSLPTLHGEVKRPMQVTLTGIGPDGEDVRIEAEGLTARCMLHEIDHLDGVLFSDRCEPGTLSWMVPDKNEEDGYRLEPTTEAEMMKAFDRLRKKQESEEESL